MPAWKFPSPDSESTRPTCLRHRRTFRTPFPPDRWSFLPNRAIQPALPVSVQSWAPSSCLARGISTIPGQRRFNALGYSGRAQRSLSELRRPFAGELQQFFDDEEIALEQLLQSWIVDRPDQLVRLLGSEIEQQNGVAEFPLGPRLLALEALHQ